MISPFNILEVDFSFKLEDAWLTGQSTAGSELAATPASEPLQSTCPSSVYCDVTKKSKGQFCHKKKQHKTVVRASFELMLQTEIKKRTTENGFVKSDAKV